MLRKKSNNKKHKKLAFSKFGASLIVSILVFGFFSSVFGSEKENTYHLSQLEQASITKEYEELSKKEKAALRSLKKKLAGDKNFIKLSTTERILLEKNLDTFSKEQKARVELGKARELAEAELLEISKPIIGVQSKNKEKNIETKTETQVNSPSFNAESKSDNLYPVDRVIDGDTISVIINGKEEKIRLIGIDAPESVHPDESKNTKCGTIASDFTKLKLEGKNVSIEKDVQERDNYGRILAYVYLNDVMFNKTLLEEGMAQVSTHPPNVKYADEFIVLQRQARENNVGLWSMDCSTQIDDAPVANSTKTEALYIGNVKSNKFHHPNCKAVKKMSEHNKLELFSREDAISSGYIPCKICNP